MTDRDPLVPALVALIVDVARFLDTCEDDEVDPDTAVKMMEGMGGQLLRLPAAQRDSLLRVLADLVEAEPDAARRDFLESFPRDFGLVDEEEN
ncbi:hypothetical protein [Streptomyces sp. NPDC102282]|uniref:hypothetical protein n=1 Tax=Streptomyces sp. NPDC102282 TaxID=3366154 RepID=UPI00381DBCCE